MKLFHFFLQKDGFITEYFFRDTSIKKIIFSHQFKVLEIYLDDGEKIYGVDFDQEEFKLMEVFLTEEFDGNVEGNLMFTSHLNHPSKT